MPHRPTAESRLSIITAYLTPVVTLLDALIDAFGCQCSFIHQISKITLSLISAVQKVKRNRDECIQLLENIHQVLYAIVDLHISSETTGSLAPSLIDDIGKFTETLRKMHRFVEAQQDGNKIKYFFCQSEKNTLLKDCHRGLNRALDVFKINIGVMTFNSIHEIQQKTDNMHTKLLELIETLSDGTLTDTLSSVYQVGNPSQNSSNSFSMLPPQPKIFHGREAELQDIIKTLSSESPRIAILGGGGMGKTHMARATLHHPDISTKFEHRYFVTAESADNSVELAALIGLHLGLDPGKDLTRPVVQYFSRMPPCLLILDNLETPWEQIKSRDGVEELLSLLTDVSHLALMITMRGAERPAKVRWTRPFLLPLKPLSDDAARQTFMDITDHSLNDEDMKQLLQLTDNMPLAVDLIAHLADYEGCANVLARWEREKTSMVSAGNDRKSDLDASIRLSLSSPRITSGAQDLLSLLSILPDGLSDPELLHSDLPVQDIRTCKATLLATSLAYIDNKQRLRSLLPIREHIQQFSPPSQALTNPLRKYFHSILDLYKKYHGPELRGIINQITLNLGNLQKVLDRGLHEDSSGLSETIYCIVNLNSFCRVTGRNSTLLMDHIPGVLSHRLDHKLAVHFIAEVLFSPQSCHLSNRESLVAQGISHCNHLNDFGLESRFYMAAGFHYFYKATNKTNDMFKAITLSEKALTLSRSGDTDQECGILITIATMRLYMGDTETAQMHLNEARRLANISANLYQEARALRLAAHCATHLGDYRNSIHCLNRATELVEICGISGGRTDHRIEIGRADLHVLKSEYKEARGIYTQRLHHTEQDPNMYAWTLVNIALIDGMIGVNDEDVYQNMAKAKTIFVGTKSIQGVSCCVMLLADVKLREGDTASAKTLFEDSLKTNLGMYGDAVSLALERLADRNRWHAVDYTFTWPVVYLAHAQKSKEKLAVHKALLFLGDIFIAQGDDDAAHSLFTVALEGFIYMDVHSSRAQCLLRLGDLSHKRGNSSHAAVLWKAAQPLFERSSQAKYVEQIEGRLAELEHTRKALVAPVHHPKQIFEEPSFATNESKSESAANQK
ncbi:hypothetical protein B0H13DRAFT_1924375 [Mycena leptocephala]|nr:hypothetical protein B0H13DRAFT_1924375 [Mycena leptocephala]